VKAAYEADCSLPESFTGPPKLCNKGAVLQHEFRYYAGGCWRQIKGWLMASSDVKIDFRKLLGFRHVVVLGGDPGLGTDIGHDQAGETASTMAKAAGALFNKGGELITSESGGDILRL
jgi:hypothetical protein